MRFLTVHIVVYATVCSFLTAVWLLTDGSADDLQRIAADPTTSIELGFWPIWVWLSWGTAVAINAGFVVSSLLFGKRARRRRRAIARAARRGTRQVTGPRRPSTRDRTPERSWVTVMFSDIASSTAHTERLGDETWMAFLKRYRRITRDAVSGRGGKQVGSQGDGILTRFSSPADAVMCAVDIQREVAKAAEDGFFPQVKIGIHAGEAVEDAGDLVGRVINLASRVTSEAEPGEILITEPVADQLVGHLELEDRGLRVLRGISQPRHLLAVRWGNGD